MKEVKGQQVVHCPQCGGNKVGVNHLVRNMTLIGGLMMLIPIAGWISGPLIIIVAFSVWFAMKRKNIVPMKCQECKHKFQVSTDNFQEYKRAIS